MKKVLVVFFVVVFVGVMGSFGFSQQQNTQTQDQDTAEYLKGFRILGEPTEAEIKDTAKQMIQPVLVEDFEVPGDWEVKMSRDYGVVSFMTRDGFPRALADIKDRNNKVLGVKVNFFKRGPAEILVRPQDK